MVFMFFVILLTFIIQIQVLPLAGLRLDLLLLITVYYGFLYGSRLGAGIGLLVGLLSDVFSAGVFGLAPVGLVFCGILAGYTGRMLLLRYWIIRVSLVFIFTILNLAVYSAMTKTFSQTELFSIFAKQWFIIGILNTIIGGTIFWLVDKYG